MEPNEELALIRKEQDRATRARHILEEPIFKDAMKALRDEAIAEFKHSDSHNVAALQHARIRYDITEAFLSKLTRHVETGAFSEVRFENLRKLMGMK